MSATARRKALSAQAVEPVVPEEWCRHVLTALTRRKIEDRATGHLEMLLAVFIQMCPSPETFVERLAEHAASGRPGLADAARVLRRAWEEGQREGSGVTPTLQETLRTLGAWLDERGARAAYATVGPDGARIQTFGELTEATFEPLALRLEVAARTTLRDEVAPTDSCAPATHEARLRAVGAALAGAPAQWLELFVTTRTIVVEGQGGYYRVWSLDELAAALAGARPATARGQSAAWVAAPGTALPRPARPPAVGRRRGAGRR